MGEQLTESDVKKIKEEIEYRKIVVRKKELEAVKEARAQGDLSENFEYKAAKQDKNRNESRIRYLERMLKTANIVSDDSKEDEIGINNTVDLYFEDDEEDTIYRIVQEGITNAIRHGHASRIFINFKKVDIWLVIRIRDNGIGCKDIHKGFGLTHMKERVDMLHGTVTYSSNNGFQVVAKLPIRWRNEER